MRSIELLLISGIFAAIAGVLILFGFPDICVWALGFLLGVDVMSHGLAALRAAIATDDRVT